MIKVWSDLNTNKIELPDPAEYTWSYSDIDKDSGRNDNGKMVRNRLGSKVKLQLTWNAEKYPNEHAQMVAILMGLPPFFYCQFLDGSGATKTIECYRGDIKRNLYRYDVSTGTIWKDTTCNFIER